MRHLQTQARFGRHHDLRREADDYRATRPGRSAWRNLLAHVFF